MVCIQVLRRSFEVVLLFRFARCGFPIAFARYAVGVDFSFGREVTTRPANLTPCGAGVDLSKRIGLVSPRCRRVEFTGTSDGESMFCFWMFAFCPGRYIPTLDGSIAMISAANGICPCDEGWSHGFYFRWMKGGWPRGMCFISGGTGASGRIL